MSRWSWKWTLATALVGVAAYWLVIRAMQTTEIETAAMPYIGHAIGGLLAGALVNSHARLRAAREPLVGGYLSIVLLSIVWLALPNPHFGWVASRAAHPWLMAALIGAISAASTWAGAAIVLRVTSSPARGPVPVGALSLFLAMGLGVVLAQAALAVSAPTWTALVAMAIALFAGGYTTQLLVADYHPIASGAGVAVLALLISLADPQRHDAAGIGGGIVGAGVFALVGAWGARRAWRRRERRGETAASDLPAARVERT